MTANRESEHLHESITALSETLPRLEEEKNLAKSQYEEAKSRYEELDGRCQIVHQAIDVLQKELGLSDHASTEFDTPAAIDLSGCKTIEERLVRIAIAKGGELNIPDARDIILAAGASRATRNDLRSSILKTVKRNAPGLGMGRGPDLQVQAALRGPGVTRPHERRPNSHTGCGTIVLTKKAPRSVRTAPKCLAHRRVGVTSGPTTV